MGDYRTFVDWSPSEYCSSKYYPCIAKITLKYGNSEIYLWSTPYDMKQVKLRISTIHQVSDDTIFIDIDPNAKFGVSDYNEIKNAVRKLDDGAGFYQIINMGALTYPTRKARELTFSVEGSYYKLADAFVIVSSFQRNMFKMLLKMYSPTVPTKIFSSVQEAKDWLTELKQERVVQTAF